MYLHIHIHTYEHNIPFIIDVFLINATVKHFKHTRGQLNLVIEASIV